LFLFVPPKESSKMIIFGRKIIRKCLIFLTVVYFGESMNGFEPRNLKTTIWFPFVTTDFSKNDFAFLSVTSYI
jgi:hypothetical protein